MSTAAPNKPPVRLAADAAKPLALTDPAKLLLTPGLSVRQYHEALAARPDLDEDAIRFLAAALPKREAIWWGLVCLRESIPMPHPEPVAKALAAVEQWVKDPSDANRRSAGSAGAEAGHGMPAGCLADAAFYSGGSLSPAKLPAVPPAEHLTALALAGGLLMAAVDDPLKAPAVRQRYLAIGQLVATGQSKW